MDIQFMFRFVEIIYISLSPLVENWFLVQYEDDPVLRVLNEREVKHLDPDDHEEMQEGETVVALWSADKEFYEGTIIKISGECFVKNKLGVV